MSAPVKEFRIGAVKVALFPKEYNGNTYYNFKFQKSYKDKQEQWQNTEYFSSQDLLNLSYLASQMAYSEMKSREINSTPQGEKVNKAEQFVQNNLSDDGEIPF